MAAGQGFKTFTTGEVLTAGDVNGYLMQGINVFTNATARDAAITAPAEGQFAFTKDNNSLWYYDGAAWVASGATGDIEGVTAGVGISGGGTSGTVTVTNSMATAIDAKGDLVPGTGADTFARLAVGANDTVLTADSSTATGLKWATPAGGGGMTLLSTTSLSGSGTVTISSINQTYKNLYIYIKDFYATTNSVINLYFNSSGTRYNYSTVENGSGQGNTSGWSTIRNVATLYNGTGGYGDGSVSNTATLIIYDYSRSSSMKNFLWFGGGIEGPATTWDSWSGGGVYMGLSAITSISTYMASNFSAGTMYIYGEN
jgi:hypothetical protein